MPEQITIFGKLGTEERAAIESKAVEAFNKRILSKLHVEGSVIGQKAKSLGAQEQREARMEVWAIEMAKNIIEELS